MASPKGPRKMSVVAKRLNPMTKFNHFNFWYLSSLEGSPGIIDINSLNEDFAFSAASFSAYNEMISRAGEALEKPDFLTAPIFLRAAAVALEQAGREFKTFLLKYPGLKQGVPDYSSGKLVNTVSLMVPYR